MEDISPSAAWGIEFSETPQGNPKIRLTKGNLWVEAVGRAGGLENGGVDNETLYQRAIISALEMDLVRARGSEEKRFIDNQLRHARKDEQVSMQLRVEDKLAKLQAEQGEGA